MDEAFDHLASIEKGGRINILGGFCSQANFCQCSRRKRIEEGWLAVQDICHFDCIQG